MQAWDGQEPRVLVLYSCSLTPFAVSSSVWLMALPPTSLDSHRNVNGSSLLKGEFAPFPWDKQRLFFDQWV